jgi:hypothetical protein
MDTDVTCQHRVSTGNTEVAPFPLRVDKAVFKWTTTLFPLSCWGSFL